MFLLILSLLFSSCSTAPIPQESRYDQKPTIRCTHRQYTASLLISSPQPLDDLESWEHKKSSTPYPSRWDCANPDSAGGRHTRDYHRTITLSNGWSISMDAASRMVR
ncbi:uncharacterized protein BP01DRAFT_99689 [Aspergillus saccharolyticus JOP 1030-1]|uniref:Uncharacterized protein n=1 Tax=Aspergillus saccharolyticus JOP 1030-1 TaxID=1450539 RepID=A0A318Z8I2_9EURO|nr:hypothetical protein BP01DRAFT_99689 [Aspergillus saccharolyticus JOP 1030-1]PYH43479.1 hypothetical protein BP01DRAFT_99689 [Aspergillus saccharolyticus JOP 1030-1]